MIENHDPWSKDQNDFLSEKISKSVKKKNGKTLKKKGSKRKKEENRNKKNSKASPEEKEIENVSWEKSLWKKEGKLLGKSPYDE